MGTHGALFFEPYDDQPDNYGHYRRHTSNDSQMHDRRHGEDVQPASRRASTAGFVPNVHAIGTKGMALMLDTYERLHDGGGCDLDGFRVIHAQVIRPQDFPRFEELGGHRRGEPLPHLR